MNRAAIGQYTPGNSIFHLMDPRLKLVFNIALIVLVFMIDNFLSLGILALLAIIAFAITPLNKRQLYRVLITILPIGFFIFIINLFTIRGADLSSHWFEPVSWWKITVSEKSLILSLRIILRIYTMTLFTTVLVATTKPLALTHAIEDLLLPFKLIRVPVHIIAMIISIALRFIPTLLEEAQRIMKSQASRGVDYKNGNFKTKAKSLGTLIVPLFVSAFAKAEDLGNAMEVRGYDPYEKRVRYRAYYPGWRDAIVGLIVVGLIVYVALALNGVITPVYWT